MVRGTHERAAFHVIKTHIIPNITKACKFIRMHEPDYGQMFLRRLELLPQCNNIYSTVPSILHGLHHFILLFPKPKHDAAFSPHTASFEDFKAFHAAPVLCLDPHLLSETF